MRSWSARGPRGFNFVFSFLGRVGGALKPGVFEGPRATLRGTDAGRLAEGPNRLGPRLRGACASGDMAPTPIARPMAHAPALLRARGSHTIRVRGLSCLAFQLRSTGPSIPTPLPAGLADGLDNACYGVLLGGKFCNFKLNRDLRSLAVLSTRTEYSVCCGSPLPRSLHSITWMDSTSLRLCRRCLEVFLTHQRPEKCPFWVVKGGNVEH